MRHLILAIMALLPLAAGCASPHPSKTPATPSRETRAEVPFDDALGMLRARREVYASEVQKAVTKTWHPKDVLDTLDPDRRLDATNERFTLLTVTLDGTGRVKQIVVARPSGVALLDECAVEAFRKAQPLPIPTADLLDETGVLRWTFRFQVKMASDR